ncbi:MAG TPA: hypothetical protein VNZ25_02910 [Candidatus Angelobacter sp.]|jgi:hypothetical protein|nr:hypothetical protein [Candidatus Angelobacter sp.]
MENVEKQKHFADAINYLAEHIKQGKKSNNNIFPLCRGDIMMLVKLINQEMQADPSALKRLTAIRGKLGDLVFDAPEMSREEAKELKDGQWA